MFDRLEKHFEKMSERPPHPFVKIPSLLPVQKAKEAIAESDMALSFCFLLHGVPGVGKTYIADHLKAERLTELRTPHGLRDAYADTVYLIDEVDRMLVSESDVRDLIMWLDNARSQGGTLVIMTTNNVDVIPEAVLRSGRVTKVLEVLPWDKDIATKFCYNAALNLNEAPCRDGKYYAGELSEWAQEKLVARWLA